MKAVVDASIIVRSVVPHQPGQDLARQWLASCDELVAPALLPFEITTALRRLEFSQLLESADAEEFLSIALSLNIRLEAPRGLHLEAMKLARLLQVSRTQDSAYLALALREECSLHTLDVRFWRNASGRGFPVVLLGEPGREDS